MSEFKIESGIPIPSAPSGKHAYPTRLLEIGQSFFVPAPNQKVVENVRSSISQDKKRGNLKDMVLVTRKVTENDVAGIRVWRIQ